MSLDRAIVATSRGAIACVAGPTIGRSALIALHPLASTGELWAPAIPRLAQRGLDVVAPTLPAPATLALGGLTVDAMADDVAALARALGRDRVTLVGMSMGGCVAIAFALRHPRLVQRLVLVDTTASYGDDRVAKWSERASAARAPQRRALLPFQLDRWFGDAFRRAHAEEVDRVADLFVRCPGDVHAACCLALGEFDATSRLREIAAPTLVIVGEDDYATPPSMARTLAEGIAGATLRVLPGVRHMSLVEAPEHWRQVSDFALGGQTESCTKS